MRKQEKYLFFVRMYVFTLHDLTQIKIINISCMLLLKYRDNILNC